MHWGGVFLLLIGLFVGTHGVRDAPCWIYGVQGLHLFTNFCSRRGMFFFTKYVTEILQNSDNTCLPPPAVEAESKRDPNQRRHIVLKERPLRLFVMFMKDAPAPCVTTVGVPRAGSEVRSE